ncbi:hypothetical protein D9M69_376690 [compost metagenome]
MRLQQFAEVDRGVEPAHFPLFSTLDQIAQQQRAEFLGRGLQCLEHFVLVKL